MVDVAIFMRNSSFTMEKTLVSHTLIDCTIRELDHAKTLPGRFVFVSLPLTLILPTLTNVNLKCVPVVAFTTT